MTLEEVARDLYGLLPEEFTERRDALAKEVRTGGDRALAARVGKLRRPRRVAWVLNMLVRRHPDEIDQLMGVGVGLRAAQQGRDGQHDLRALDQQRRELTIVLVKHARAVGTELDRELSDELVAEVETTLRAAMADPAGSAALRSGLLLDGFSTSGFESIDVERVVAVPEAVPETEPDPPSTPSPTAQPRRTSKSPATKQRAAKQRPAERKPSPSKTPAKQPGRTQRQRPRTRTDEKPARARKQAEEALEAARRTRDEAAESADRAAQELADATQARRDIEEERSALQERLRTLDRDFTRAHRAEDRADRASTSAQRQRDEAQRAVDRAEKLVEQSRPG